MSVAGKRKQAELARALRELLAATERAQTDQDLDLVADVLATVRFEKAVPQLAGVETLLTAAAARLNRISRRAGDH